MEPPGLGRVTWPIWSWWGEHTPGQIQQHSRYLLWGKRFGNLEVRPLGGGLGCLLMVLFSVVASVVLTVLINLLLR